MLFIVPQVPLLLFIRLIVSSCTEHNLGVCAFSVILSFVVGFILGLDLISVEIFCAHDDYNLINVILNRGTFGLFEY